MSTFEKIKTFNDKYPLVGPAFWLVSVQYFITQLIVALQWSPAYSITKNTISDLGNTTCGIYSSRLVCSPMHSLMNASFIVLGITMVSGSTLIYHEFHKQKGNKLAFSLMAAAGLGAILVGIFPENSLGKLHFLGAVLAILVGNLAILLFGWILDLSSTLRIYTIITALITLSAFVLFATKFYLGLGVGGMERLASYPQTLWLIVFGIYMMRSHFKRVALKAGHSGNRELKN